MLLNGNRKVFEVPKTNSEKFQLIRKWYGWFYEVSQDWDGILGAEIAYLMGAIINDTCIEVDTTSPLLNLMRQRDVDSSDPIWKYLYFANN